MAFNGLGVEPARISQKGSVRELAIANKNTAQVRCPFTYFFRSVGSVPGFHSSAASPFKSKIALPARKVNSVVNR